MSGGLGNQMFQYALYLALGAEGREVRIDETTEYGEHERLRHPELREDFGAQLPSYRVATQEEIVALTDSYMDFLSRVRRKLTGRRTKLYAERKPYVFDPAVLGASDILPPCGRRCDRRFPWTACGSPAGGGSMRG